MLLEGLEVEGSTVGREVGLQVDNTLGDNDETVVGFDDTSKVGSPEGRRLDFEVGDLLILVVGVAVGFRKLGLDEGASLGAEEVGLAVGFLLGFAGFLVGQVIVGATVVDGLAVEGVLVGVCGQNMEQVLLEMSHTAPGLQQSLLVLQPTCVPVTKHAEVCPGRTVLTR